jgi:hypothetical protein
MFLKLIKSPVVINTASGFHSGLARALIVGLSQRKKETGKEVYYFHVRHFSSVQTPNRFLY